MKYYQYRTMSPIIIYTLIYITIYAHIRTHANSHTHTHSLLRDVTFACSPSKWGRGRCGGVQCSLWFAKRFNFSHERKMWQHVMLPMQTHTHMQLQAKAPL